MWSANEAPPRQLHNRFRTMPANETKAAKAAKQAEDSPAFDQLRECLAVIRRALAPFPEAFDAVVQALAQPGPHAPQRCPVT